jgi:hypothetical protein
MTNGEFHVDKVFLEKHAERIGGLINAYGRIGMGYSKRDVHLAPYIRVDRIPQQEDATFLADFFGQKEPKLRLKRQGVYRWDTGIRSEENVLTILSVLLAKGALPSPRQRRCAELVRESLEDRKLHGTMTQRQMDLRSELRPLMSQGYTFQEGELPKKRAQKNWSRQQKNTQTRARHPVG